MAAVPAYDDLPLLGGLGIRHAREALPPEWGTLAFIGPEQVAAASQLVREGETVALNLPIDAFDPPLFGRAQLAHRIIEPARNEAEDVIDSFNPQASSQLDGLAHVRAREFGYFNGSTDLDAARSAIGMHHWAQRGIAARGVLLDLTADAPDPFSGRGLTPADLEAVARRQGVELRRGDVLLVRTGWASARLADSSEPPRAWTGLEASDEMAAFLWNSGIAAVGSDNPAVENAPGDPRIGSLHRRLLPGLGMPMFELLELEMLARATRRLNRWEFLFVSVPLHVRGAVSSPANAMALL